MTTLMDVKHSIRSHKLFENEGSKILGILHRPKDVLNPPLVIMHHGFASHKVGTRRSHVHLAEALCRNKIAALRFDMRGHGDSEGDLDHLGFSDLFGDASLVLKEMKKEGFGTIALYGSSLGGSIASLVASLSPDIAALALWAPPASGELWARDFLNKNQDISFKSYRGATISEKFRNEFLQMKAYLAIAHTDHMPLWHGFGEQDEVLSIDHKLAFEKARGCAKNKSTFRFYKDTSHYLGNSPQMEEIVQEIANWYKAILLKNDS